MSESGWIKNLGRKHYRAILAVAYEVSFAKRMADGLLEEKFNLRWRVPSLEYQKRSQFVPLYKLDIHHFQTNFDVSVNSAADSFLRAIPEERLRLLLKWALPVVGAFPESDQVKIYNGQLIVAMASYKLPTFAPRLKLLASPPRRQLTISESCALTLQTFEQFVANNSELICCLSETADEAALLTGLSRSRASEIRQAVGTIQL